MYVKVRQSIKQFEKRNANIVCIKKTFLIILAEAKKSLVYINIHVCVCVVDNSDTKE